MRPRQVGSAALLLPPGGHPAPLHVGRGRGPVLHAEGRLPLPRESPCRGADQAAVCFFVLSFFFFSIKILFIEDFCPQIMTKNAVNRSLQR